MYIYIYTCIYIHIHIYIYIYKKAISYTLYMYLLSVFLFPSLVASHVGTQFWRCSLGKGLGEVKSLQHQEEAGNLLTCLIGDL